MLPLYTTTHSTNAIKFADDTTAVGLIHNGHRDEVRRLLEWFSINNLALNTSQTKELIISFRKQKEEPAPPYIRGDSVERVANFKFLGTHLSGPHMDC